MSRSLVASFTRVFPGGAEVSVENLEIPESAEVTILFGSSGAGKTTVLRCLAGIERPDSGSIRLGEETWFDGARGIYLPPRNRGLGFVPQDYALFPHLSLEKNVAYGLGSLSSTERRARVREMLDLVGLQGLEKRLPAELSGGQQQRAALARAVAPKPRLLLLDEPLSAVDAPTRQQLRGELRRQLSRLQVPTLIVTHDRSEALALGDRVVLIENGRIVQQGRPQEVFNRPASLSVAALVGIETVQPARVVRADAGLATVRLGEVELTAVAETLPVDAADVFACIRASDVILTAGGPGATSARNHLQGTVRSLSPEGLLMCVELDCGFLLKALLTRQACEDLALKPGISVHALIKAPNIHLIAR